MDMQTKYTKDRFCRTLHTYMPVALLLFLVGMVPIITFDYTYAKEIGSKDKESAYVYGVFPFLPASRLEGVFAPIAKELRLSLNRKILYRSASTFKKFMARLEQQEFDIAFIQPFDYVSIAAKVNYLPVVKRREPLYAVFVVKKDSPFQKIYDLKGKIIAMAPEVAALSYLGKTALIDAGLDPERDVTIKHLRGHHSCLQHVVVGEASACTTGLPALRVFEAKMGFKLRVLDETSAIPQVLFVVHSRVPERDKKLIKKTLLATSLSEVVPELRTLLVKNSNKPFISATDADYDIVREYWKELEKNK